MPLADTVIRKVKPTAKTRKLSDGGGMYLEIPPSGRKWWRLKSRFGDKEKRLSLGTYPDTSLANACVARDDARQLLAKGIDPSAHRKANKAIHANPFSNSFEAIAREWFAKQSPLWTQRHIDKILFRLQKNVSPDSANVHHRYFCQSSA